MYEPIAKDDSETICALLNMYRKVYRYIGLIILGIGLCIMPFLKYLISGSYPEDINLYLLFFMYLLNSVLSYWLYAYKVSLLNAFQRIDITNITNVAVCMLTSFLQICVLYFKANFYLYLTVVLFTTLVNNFMNAATVNKMYPQYQCRGKVSKEILHDLKKRLTGLFIYRFCGITRNSFDSIFISMFLGLVMTGMYNNYYYVLTSVTGFLSIINQSMLSGWCAICMACLYQPFMRLWVGDELMFPQIIAILFSVYFYETCMGNVRSLYADGAGLWWENRHRTVAESVSNIIMNYFFVRMWGVKGIIMATMISLFVFGFAGSAIVVYRSYFKHGLADYFKRHGCYCLVTLLNGGVTFFLCVAMHQTGWIDLLLRGVLCCTVCPFLYFLLYCRTKMFKEAIPWLKQRVRRYPI